MKKVRNSPRPATFQSGDCKVAISGHVMSSKNGTGVRRCASNPKETEKWPLSAMSRRCGAQRRISRSRSVRAAHLKAKELV
jgi:hypothetical protein